MTESFEMSLEESHPGRFSLAGMTLPHSRLLKTEMETREGVDHQKAKHLTNWVSDYIQLIYNHFAILYSISLDLS